MVPPAGGERVRERAQISRPDSEGIVDARLRSDQHWEIRCVFSKRNQKLQPISWPECGIVAIAPLFSFYLQTHQMA